MNKILSVIPGFLLCTALLTACGSDNTVNETTVDILDGQTYSACLGTQRISYAFDNGNATRTTATYGATDCAGTATSSVADSLTYSTGGTIKDKDNNSVTEFNLVEDNVTTYTIKRLLGGSLGISNLQLGSTSASSSGKDGTTSAKRHDGLESTVSYVLQN